MAIHTLPSLSVVMLLTSFSFTSLLMGYAWWYSCIKLVSLKLVCCAPALAEQSRQIKSIQLHCMIVGLYIRFDLFFNQDDCIY